VARDVRNSLFDALPFGVCLVDADFRVLDCNVRFGELAGIGGAPESLLGIDLAKDRDALRYGFLVRARRGEHVHQVARLALVPGANPVDAELDVQPFSMEGKLPPIKGDAGDFRASAVIVSVCRAKTLGSSVESGSQRIGLGMLAAGISHEFNNLHAGIMGFLQLDLRRSDLDPLLRQDLEKMFALVKRASAISKNLMAFARRRHTIMGATDLKALISEALDSVAGELAQAGVSVDVHFVGKVLDVYVDRNQISQVLTNLVRNAKDAMLFSTSRTLALNVSREGSMACVEVQDSGRGIPSDDLGRVFDPFFTTKGSAARGQSPERHLNGVGLGLSVCRSITEQHGGWMDVASQVGRGSSFRVYLPLLEALGDIAERTPVDQDKVGGDRPSVLVVDDEVSLRELLVRVAELEGAACDQAADGADAIAILEKRTYDVLVMDMQMPGVSGMDILDHVSEMPVDSRPTVIVATGRVSDMEEVASKVHHVLRKPFGIEEFQEAFRSALSSHPDG